MSQLRILVACEESQTVTKAFRDAGHLAFSCDIKPCSGGYPEWHIQGDAMEAMDEGPFYTKDSEDPGPWHIIILHPPCTAMCNSGNRHYGVGMQKHNSRLEAIEWTKKLWDKAKDVAIIGCALENPVSVIFKHIEGHLQYVQPYQFGHMEQKKTGFMLHGLPPLKESQNVYEQMMALPIKQRNRIHYMSPGPKRGELRSKTYQGIANAMVTAWARFRAFV